MVRIIPHLPSPAFGVIRVTQFVIPLPEPAIIMVIILKQRNPPRTRQHREVQPQCVEQDQVFDAGRNDAWRGGDRSNGHC